MEKHSYSYRKDLHNNVRNFDKDLKEKMAKIPYQSLIMAMNELDNHDHSRFLTRTSGIIDSLKPSMDYSNPEKANKNVNKGILKEAVILQFTLPGAPTIYYGDEAGLAGWTDPDSRRTYPWGREDKELLEFYKQIIQIHKKYSSLIDGSLITLFTSELNKIYSYARWDENNVVIVAINNGKKDYNASIPVDKLGIPDNEEFILIFKSNKENHFSETQSVNVKDGEIKIKIPSYGGVILVMEKGINDPVCSIEKNPVIVGTSPKDKGQNVKPDAIIKIKFSEPMNRRQIIDAFSIEPYVKGKFLWNGTILLFIPEKGFEYNTTYKVTIKKNITSIDGNLRLAEDYVFTFDTIKPK
jgi:hypothetical protein